MAEKSRIKFNPQSQEFEIEGTEKFVKTYFKIIQQMRLEDQEKNIKGTRREDRPEKDREEASAIKSKQKGKTAKKAGKKPRRGDISGTLIDLVKASNGITTADLVKKSGFAEQQVRSVIYRAHETWTNRQTKEGHICLSLTGC